MPVQGVEINGDVIQFLPANLKYQLKRKMDGNVKVPVTSKPDKLLRTYDVQNVLFALKTSNLLIENTGDSFANV